jgi:hypothetical protein
LLGTFEGQPIDSRPLGIDLAEDHDGDDRPGFGVALPGNHDALAFSAADPRPTGRTAITANPPHRVRASNAHVRLRTG